MIGLSKAKTIRIQKLAEQLDDNIDPLDKKAVKELKKKILSQVKILDKILLILNPPKA